MSKYIVEVEVEAGDADNARDDVDWALREFGLNAATIAAYNKDDHDAAQPYEDFDNG